MKLSEKSMDKLFPPKHFNDSGEVGNILLGREKKILIISKQPSKDKDRNNIEIYSTFFDMFNNALNKFPNTDIKKIVSEINNKNSIYLGHSTDNKEDSLICARISINQQISTLVGVILNTSYLGIDESTGHVSNANECIYAAYYGLIRATILLNSQKISKDIDLHKNLIAYLNLLMLKVLGKKLLDSEKQRRIVLMACIYIYYRHFLQHKHAMTISIMKKEYIDLLTKEFIHEHIDMLDMVSKYSNMKDLGKIFVDLHIIREDPSNIIMEMFRMFKSSGFYGIISSLDIFIAMCCLTQYPTEIFAKTCFTSGKIHKAVDDIVRKYFNSVKIAQN